MGGSNKNINAPLLNGQDRVQSTANQQVPLAARIAAPTQNVLPDQSQTFVPYDLYMPDVYNTNQPIYDPTAIIQGYMNNMPAFLKASQGNITMPPATALKSTQSGK